MADAGKIAPTYDGEWSADKTYDFHTYVTHNNNCYIAKQPSTGVEPTEEDNAYWFLALKNVSAEELSNLQKLIEAIISGTTTVGNANKLGGKGASEYALQSAVDSIQTRNSKAFTTNGWYRIARIPTCDENYCKLVIVKQWASVGSETHVIEYVQTHSNRVLISTSDNVTSMQAIKKARVATEGNYRYIEIYYNANSVDSNRIAWSVVDNASINATDRWQTIDAVLTSETVDGVTVEATYDIPANASPVTDLDLVQFKGTNRINTSILDFALTVPTNENYYCTLGGSNYGGTDLPDGMYKYSNAMITGYVNTKTVIIFGRYGYKPIINHYTVDFGWEGWKTIATTADLANYLPLTGGDINGYLQLIASDSTSRHVKIKNSLRDIYMQILGNGSFRIYDQTNSKEILASDVNGTTTFNGKATGQGNPVAIQSSAPSDTSALWVDNANKVIKAYIDGAWTLVS